MREMTDAELAAELEKQKKDLQQRLVQKGEDPAQAAEAVAWMEQMHLVDDAETARQVVGRCIARGYGLSRAKQALYEKQIPKQYWDAALADYPDQYEHIMAFLRSRLADPNDRQQVKRTVDALLRRGHHYSEIRRCLQRLSAEPEEFPEDYEWQM